MLRQGSVWGFDMWVSSVCNRFAERFGIPKELCGKTWPDRVEVWREDEETIGAYCPEINKTLFCKADRIDEESEYSSKFTKEDEEEYSHR